MFSSSLSNGGYRENLTPEGPVVSEEKLFKNTDRRQTTNADNEAYLYYKITRETKAQECLKSTVWPFFHTKA